MNLSYHPSASGTISCQLHGLLSLRPHVCPPTHHYTHSSIHPPTFNPHTHSPVNPPSHPSTYPVLAECLLCPQLCGCLAMRWWAESDSPRAHDPRVHHGDPCLRMWVCKHWFDETAHVYLLVLIKTVAFSKEKDVLINPNPQTKVFNKFICEKS